MRKTLILFAVLIACCAGAPNARGDWKTEADARIDKHRKSDLEITVTENGKPLAGARVELKMRRHDFLFGCNVFKWRKCRTEKENAEYERLFADVFNTATIGFYWWDYEPRMNEPRHGDTMRVVDWCVENAITPKGHPLAWNFRDPQWVGGIDDEELDRRQMERIADCTEHFRGKITIWDVINETVEFKREECRRDSPRLTGIMEKHETTDYIVACFEAARKKDLGATMLINDYVVDDRYAELLEKCPGRGGGKRLFDAIGLQSHMHWGIWDNERIRETCRRFEKFDVPLHFTELTILSCENAFDGGNPEKNRTSEAGERKQRDEVERVYTILFSEPSVEAIVWWDFSDQGAWMEAPSGLVRDDMTPKPAYDTLKKLVKETWATNQTLKTDENGIVALRAFRGAYEIELTLPNGEKYEWNFPLIVRGENNKMSIELGSTKR